MGATITITGQMQKVYQVDHRVLGRWKRVAKGGEEVEGVETMSLLSYLQVHLFYFGGCWLRSTRFTFPLVPGSYPLLFSAEFWVAL